MNDFKLCQTITCPECNVKQTGVIKESAGVVVQIASAEYGRLETLVSLPVGTHYIRCAYMKCQAIITGDDLEEITRPVVQFPSDLRQISITNQ